MEIWTPLNDGPLLATVTECEPPEIATVIVPLMPPLIESVIRLAVARPETEPDWLYVRSSQLPLTAPLASTRLARSSIFDEAFAHRIERPRLCGPPLFV